LRKPPGELASIKNSVETVNALWTARIYVFQAKKMFRHELRR